MAEEILSCLFSHSGESEVREDPKSPCPVFLLGDRSGALVIWRCPDPSSDASPSIATTTREIRQHPAPRTMLRLQEPIVAVLPLSTPQSDPRAAQEARGLVLLGKSGHCELRFVEPAGEHERPRLIRFQVAGPVESAAMTRRGALCHVTGGRLFCTPMFLSGLAKCGDSGGSSSRRTHCCSSTGHNMLADAALSVEISVAGHVVGCAASGGEKEMLTVVTAGGRVVNLPETSLGAALANRNPPRGLTGLKAMRYSKSSETRIGIPWTEATAHAASGLHSSNANQVKVQHSPTEAVRMKYGPEAISTCMGKRLRLLRRRSLESHAWTDVCERELDQLAAFRNALVVAGHSSQLGRAPERVRLASSCAQDGICRSSAHGVRVPNLPGGQGPPLGPATKILEDTSAASVLKQLQFLLEGDKRLLQAEIVVPSDIAPVLHLPQWVFIVSVTTLHTITARPLRRSHSIPSRLVEAMKLQGGAPKGHVCYLIRLPMYFETLQPLHLTLGLSFMGQPLLSRWSWTKETAKVWEHTRNTGANSISVFLPLSNRRCDLLTCNAAKLPDSTSGDVHSIRQAWQMLRRHTPSQAMTELRVALRLVGFSQRQGLIPALCAREDPGIAEDTFSSVYRLTQRIRLAHTNARAWGAESMDERAVVRMVMEVLVARLGLWKIVERQSNEMSATFTLEGAEIARIAARTAESGKLVTDVVMDVDVDVHCTHWTHLPLMHEALFSVMHSAAAFQQAAHGEEAPAQLRCLSDQIALDCIRSSLEAPRVALCGIADKISLVTNHLRRWRSWSGRGQCAIALPSTANSFLGLQAASSLAVSLLNLFCDIRLATGTSAMPVTSSAASAYETKEQVNSGDSQR